MSSKLSAPKIKQSGQVIIILLLLMLVALSVGLAFTQRSVTDITTSTQTEQASRAFSAAEAGIQKAISSPLPNGQLIPLSNNSSAVVDSSGLVPYANSGVAIEYPKIGRETTAQFWFVDPLVIVPPQAPAYYNTSRVDLYYGNELTTDLPAVEVKIIMQSGANFYSYNKYYDSSASRSAPPNGNGFEYTLGCNSVDLSSSTLGNNRRFFCKQIIDNIPNMATGSGLCIPSNGCTLILARVRLLYVNDNHSLALAPYGTNFPPQVQIYNATGSSGQSQKQIQAFKVKDVVLPWFDFAIFSTNEILK